MAKEKKKDDGLTPLARRKKEAMGEGKARTIGAPSVSGGQQSKAAPRKRATKKKR